MIPGHRDWECISNDAQKKWNYPKKKKNPKAKYSLVTKWGLKMTFFCPLSGAKTKGFLKGHNYFTVTNKSSNAVSQWFLKDSTATIIFILRNLESLSPIRPKTGPYHAFQKWLRNLDSLSLTPYHSLWSWEYHAIWPHTNKEETLEASSNLLHAMKCAILENRSTTTKMLSFPYFVLGKPNTKSMEVSNQGLWGVGRWVYKPWGRSLDSVLLHSTH